MIVFIVITDTYSDSWFAFIVEYSYLSVMAAREKTKETVEIVQTALRIPKDKHKELRLLSVYQDKSLNELWLEALDDLLKKYSGKKWVE